MMFLEKRREFVHDCQRMELRPDDGSKRRIDARINGWIVEDAVAIETNDVANATNAIRTQSMMSRTRSRIVFWLATILTIPFPRFTFVFLGRIPGIV